MSTSRPDFDSPWKEALEWYFEAFIQLCFPQVHTTIDWSKPYEFLDKELQQIVRDAELGKRFADKLIKVWLQEGSELWLLIHVEVQGKRETDFAERMYRYNYRISDRYNQPVLSLAVLCDANPWWRPTEFTRQILGCEVQFRFPIAKLLDYRQQWNDLEQSQNPFSTVIMAHLKAQETQRNPGQRKNWKFALTRNLYEKGYVKQDILNLFHFIDWVMKLPKALEQAFWQELDEYEQERRMPYITSVERIGIEKGLKQGRQEGRQEEATRLSIKILQRRFGSVPEEISLRLRALSVDRLENLMDIMLTADSLEQFVEHLPAAELLDNQPPS